MNRIRLLAAVLVLCLGGAMLFAQQVTEKKEIAVFNLSYYDMNIPSAALGQIDENIRSVFINMKRFDVIGLTQRLAANDVETFIAKIKEIKEKNMSIPEGVRLGQVAFTEADFNKLVGAFLIVIPSVSFFNVEQNRDGSYRATMKVSFTFINAAEAKTIAQFFLETSGSDKNYNVAVKNAVDGIPNALRFKVTTIPEFQIKTGIIEITGSDVVMELGANMGLEVGEEYSLLTVGTVAGYESQKEAGLIVIKDVQERFSVGHLIYADRQAVVGDQLREIPRVGGEATPYLSAMYTGASSASILPIIGLKAVATRGFYSLRPTFNLEIPIDLSTGVAILFGFIPHHIALGVEIGNMYLGRLQVAPSASFVYAGVYATEQAQSNYGLSEAYLLTHVGARANVSLTYLITRDIKFMVEGGFNALFGLFSGGSGTGKDFFASKFGPQFSVGVTFK